MEVALDIQSGDDRIRVARRAEVPPDGPPQVVADMTINASPVVASMIQAEVGRLLHPQISDFFLFDAELIEDFYGRLESDRERGLIRDSIEAVLGIPALQRAQRDLQELATDALRRQTKSARNKKEAAKIEQKLALLDDKRKSLERDREDLTTELEKT